MKTRVLAIAVAFFFLLFVGVFVWAALRLPAADRTPAQDAAPTASFSETLSEGRIAGQVYALGNLEVRLEIQFTPDANAIEAAALRPDVNFAMMETHMDGLDPPLQPVGTGTGTWRTEVKLPMAGRWVVNVGFAEDFAEVEFDAQ